jgi:hypothetical protein
MNLTTPTNTLSTISTKKTDFTALQKLNASPAELKKHRKLIDEVLQLEKSIRVEKARKLIISKTFSSSTQAAQKVGMPVTSFRRMVSEFNLPPSATLDGLPVYSPEWLDAFSKYQISLEIGRDSIRMGRKEGHAIIANAIKQISRYAIETTPAKSVGSVPVTPQKTIEKIKTSKGLELIVTTNADGSRIYTRPDGSLYASAMPTRKDSNSPIEKVKQENSARHEASAQRVKAESEERRVRQLRKLKGLE